MKTFAISAALVIAATLAMAAPQGGPDWAPVQGRQFRAQNTFSGAGPNPPTYSISAPVDGSAFTIDNPLSVSHITSLGGATCGFTGAEGSETTVVGAQTVDVGPPQPQVSGSCI